MKVDEFSIINSHNYVLPNQTLGSLVEFFDSFLKSRTILFSVIDDDVLENVFAL